MGYVVFKNKQTSTPTPKPPQYTTVERFVEYAEAMFNDDYKNLEEFLADAKEQWVEFLEFEEGKLTDEILAAAATRLEHFFKRKNF